MYKVSNNACELLYTSRSAPKPRLITGSGLFPAIVFYKKRGKGIETGSGRRKKF